MTTKHAQGTHLYIDTISPETPDHLRAFYSRRGSGPYYRWIYDKKLKRWYGSRVSPNAVPQSLRAAGHIVPCALRTELLNHYQDW